MSAWKALRNVGFVTSSDGNLGLLLLRLFIGFGIFTHGLPKLQGGPELWEKMGGVMTGLGVPGPAVFWGFMAAFAEGVGGILLALGAFTTLASFLVAFTMAIAFLVVHQADPFAKKEMAALYFFGATTFLFKGAGRFSIDSLLRPRIAGKN
ncbi:MAG: DoxX family protein [Kiritimatiellia bacterium]|nr:DoxX family protein [Kiritimatiellia bacterium]